MRRGRYGVGDLVYDTVRDAVGVVCDRELGVVELEDCQGYRWRAVAARCRLVKEAPPEQPVPPGTHPVDATPEAVRIGGWVRVEDGRIYQIQDMRSNGPGGRVLFLAGRVRPWVMPSNSVRQVYRPVWSDG